MSTPDTDLEPRQLEQILPRQASDTSNYSWWGMVLLIATEATLFGILIASYFYLRFRHGAVWPPEGIKMPTLKLPLIMTAVLWSSSVPVHIADRGVRKGNYRALRFGLLAGFVLGAAFLAMQVGIEYREKLKEFTPTTNVYGSLFYTLTGFHGLHVAAGLAMSLWTQALAWRGTFSPERHMTVKNFAMYWHFVDVVWLFVLGTIYLSPNFF